MRTCPGLRRLVFAGRREEGGREGLLSGRCWVTREGRGTCWGTGSLSRYRELFAELPVYLEQDSGGSGSRQLGGSAS